MDFIYICGKILNFACENIKLSVLRRCASVYYYIALQKCRAAVN